MENKAIDLVQLLCDEHILQRFEIVNFGVQIIQEIRDRFIISKISIKNEAVYLIKNARNIESSKALHKEWSVYKYLTHHNVLHTIVPRLILDECKESLIVIEWINGENSITSSLDREKVLILMAQNLAKLHIYTSKVTNIVDDTIKTWIIENLSKEEEWNKFSYLETHIEEKDKKEIIRGMQDANNQWESNALIHGDFKWEHCLITKYLDKSYIQFIDWELSTYGDSAWDVACILSDIIFDQHYMKITYPKTIFEILMSQHIDIFLKNYCHETTCNDDFLERVSIFCAARLFQTYLELVTVYGWEDKESKVKLLLSLSLDIFKNIDLVSDIIKQKII